TVLGATLPSTSPIPHFCASLHHLLECLSGGCLGHANPHEPVPAQLTDLLVLLMGMPLELLEMWQSCPFLFGEGGCYFKTFLFETVCFASILNVTALSVESLSTCARVKRVILLLWVMSNTSLHVSFLLTEYTFGYVLIHIFIHYPLKTQVFVFYYHIVLKIFSVSHPHALPPVPCPAPLSRTGVLVVVFSLCWAPFHVDRLMWSFLDTSSKLHLMIFEPMHIVSRVFFYLSSVVNPILYSLRSTRFREMFSHMTCPRYSWPSRSSLTQRSTLTQKEVNNGLS
uniref:Neuromedin U receptor 1 n=1 Tax=Neogobius melanostomus TaxID=47308 RepID=A0A8C6WFS9_9GOBI